MAKVLIINHDEQTMSLLKKWLEERGLQAKYVTEQEAILALKDFKPDVVLIDALEIKAAKKIKQDKELSETPIVVIADNYLPKKEYITIANEVVQKPFDSNEIVKKIEKVLKSKGLT